MPLLRFRGSAVACGDPRACGYPWAAIQEMLESTSKGTPITIGGKSYPKYGTLSVQGSGYGSYLQRRRLYVKKLSLVIVLFSLQVACGSRFVGSEGVVDRSVGALLISHDRMYSHDGGVNELAGPMLYEEFQEIYDSKIRPLPEGELLRFLWSAMWHFCFDGHLMEEFQELVLDDCGDLFIDRLERYVEVESELQRNKSRLYLSEKVLAGLKMSAKLRKPTREPE